MNAPMKDSEYVANCGHLCPFCHSNNVEAGRFDFDCGNAWQEVVCKDCNAEWQDIYNLVGYEKIEGHSA